MENLKFNVGDNVKIVSNDLQPAMVGKIGRVKKVYPSFSEDSDNNVQPSYFYRVEVGGAVLKGIGFRIAGGVIIFKIGFDMLQARYTPMKLKDEEIKTYADDISITPLGIPMLCGPGAIANAIVLMQDAHSYEMKGILIGTIALIYLLTFFILRASTKLVNVLGETGNNVMMRLMGLILMVIAVECFVSGLKPILVDIVREGMLP